MVLSVHFQDWQRGPIRIDLRVLLKEILDGCKRTQHDDDLIKNAKTDNIALESEFELGQAGHVVQRLLHLPYFLDISAYTVQGAFFGMSSRLPINGRDGGPGG